MRRLTMWPFLVMTLLAVARAASAQVTTTATSSWNREAAAAYLDQRMDEWFAKGARLRTGDGETTCVSCHTVIPYALARPALRRAMHGKTSTAPTPQEAQLVDETSRRVQTYDAHQLLYDFDDDKKGESRGTEAVLYALILASADAGQALREPRDATRRAMTRLWQTQRTDGAWDWLDVGLEPFESIDSAYQGAAFAALAAGMTSSSSSGADARPAIAKLRNYLRTNYPRQNLHNRTWGLLASTSLDQVLTRAERDELVAELQRRQGDDGGWSLDGLGPWRWNRTIPPFQSPGKRDPSVTAKSDGYATGLIVYTFMQAGLSGEHPVVKRGLQWLRANQLPVHVGDQEGPAWRAHSLNYDREHGGSRGEPWRRLFMSDAATAFASLALSAAE
jgi:squalene-hopene/tetraprenyl-beta-curcumene cyclase